jgi:hypothetical protein
MVVVMCDHGYGNGEVEGEDIQGPVKAEVPLNEEEGGSEQEIDQGLNVGIVF